MTFKIACGDNLDLWGSQLEGRPADLIFMDPPYNIGQPYDVFDDSMNMPDFLDWLFPRIDKSSQNLSATGSMWIMVPDTIVSEVDVFCKGKVGLHKRNHVIWYYTFGQAASNNFTSSHVSILYYVKDRKNFTFNKDDQALRVPSARQLKYGDKRANPLGKLPDNTWALLKEHHESILDPEGNVVMESRVCGTFKERQGLTPNQLPEAITDRIVLACSNPGDLVIDPFCGSGTTGASAVKYGRDFIGFDLSQEYVDAAINRISQIEVQDIERNTDV